MSFLFGSKEKPGEAVRRIALEELDRARTELASATEDAYALHEVRKRLKKLRALLHLARTALGPHTRAEDRLLRDVARQLARHRETDAIGGLLALEAQAAGSADLDDLSAALRLHQEARAVTPDRKRDLEAAARTLGALRRRLAIVPFEPFRRRDCRRRFRKSYKAARAAYWIAREELSDENLHEWRKRAKILLNQARLLAAWGGATLTAYRTRLVNLDDNLGRARDCSFLALILRGMPAAEQPLRYGLGLRARLETNARDEIARALRIGGRVFRRLPRTFVERMLE